MNNPDNQAPVLSISDLQMAYAPGKDVLDGISLALEPGSVTGLLGRNGSGKTTLMRIALGLMRPNAGMVTLFGAPAWDAPADVRCRIGYVPQTEVPYSWLRVKDCLTLVGSFYPNWDHKLVKRYVNDWDIDGTAFIQDLSTGQKQKVAILIAIGHRPDLLILDEPVASLDPNARRQFLRALVELNEDLAHTILFSIHITSDLERVAARLAILSAGKLAFEGELDELKEQCQRLHFNGGTLPETLAEPGISNYEMKGNRATAFARNVTLEQRNSLAKLLGTEIVAEHLPLEELFLEITHG